MALPSILDLYDLQNARLSRLMFGQERTRRFAFRDKFSNCPANAHLRSNFRVLKRRAVSNRVGEDQFRGTGKYPNR
ncbi:hypothetical protein AGR1A_Lc100182 [Agrobacterium fabacearum CFBP 5771]|nr:hypothetical protein AGR1A_Lc100182 [Agrobacterium fabacearum CFBP 5771]